MENLHDDGILKIFHELDKDSKFNFLLSSEHFQNVVSSSPIHLNNYTLIIESSNFKKVLSTENFYVPLRNLTINYENTMTVKDLITYTNRFQNTILNLELNNFKFNNFLEISNFLKNLQNLQSLKFNNCHIRYLHNETLTPIRTLKSLEFNKCNDNIFKVFTKQETLVKITVSNDDWTWNGFPHEVFNEICKNSKSLYHLVLNGAGTGSYFDCDEFPYKIRKLETTMISFHWYVGIRSARSNFLESQKGFLKDLTIHELPYDFDGGKLLKYIIEEMDLDYFYFGDIPLIVKKVKQIVQEFAASEIQITSALEMVSQFICHKLILKLSKTDIASDDIEKIINPPTDVFKNIKEFEVVDNSAFRGIFGVFLGLLRNLNNVEKITLNTMDRNINTILEYLPRMALLEEMCLTSTAPRVTERLNAIKKCAPNLRKLSISKNFVNDARKVFKNIEINEI